VRLKARRGSEQYQATNSRGDPSVAIDDIDNVEITFANGAAFDPEKLLAELNGQVGWR